MVVVRKCAFRPLRKESWVKQDMVKKGKDAKYFFSFKKRGLVEIKRTLLANHVSKSM